MEAFSLSDWLTLVGYFLLAAFGGLLGYVMREKEKDKGSELNRPRAAIDTGDVRVCRLPRHASMPHDGARPAVIGCDRRLVGLGRRKRVDPASGKARL